MPRRSPGQLYTTPEQVKGELLKHMIRCTAVKEMIETEKTTKQIALCVCECFLCAPDLYSPKMEKWILEEFLANPRD